MINLRISEEQFNELYPDLVGYYEHLDIPPNSNISKEDFERKYLSSKLWRLNNIYKIINKDGDSVVFRMNYAQHHVYASTRSHPRVIVLKSRQQGISTLWLVSYFDDSLFAKNFEIGLMAQGADEAGKLLERTKFLWRNLHQSIKDFVGLNLLKDNSKEFSFSNNCKIYIRTSFRSATLQRLHISEYGKIANISPAKARETKTGTLQTLAKGNTGIIESTAEGINDFKDMWDKAVIASNSDTMSAKDFYPVFLPWFRDPDCVEPVDQLVHNEAEEYFKKLTADTGVVLTRKQKNFWIAQHRELGGDVHQEYPGTPKEAFSASKNGSYWSTKFTESVVEKGRVRKGVYDPQLSVDVFFDIGVRDYMVCAFTQQYKGQRRLIDEYINTDFGMEHYIDEIESRGYRIRNLQYPHDIKVREVMTGGGGRAVERAVLLRKMLKKKKLDWKVVRYNKSRKEDGIQAVRTMMDDCVVDVNCEYLISCFHKYSKQWDERLQIWRKTPREDEYEHGADTLQGFAIWSTESESSEEIRIRRMTKARVRNTSFDI